MGSLDVDYLFTNLQGLGIFTAKMVMFQHSIGMHGRDPVVNP